MIVLCRQYVGTCVAVNLFGHQKLVFKLEVVFCDYTTTRMIQPHVCEHTRVAKVGGNSC